MITDQGQRVAAHWSSLAVTVNGALAFLKDRGIAPDHAEAEDLHAIDMIHMGGVAATDSLAAMAGITAGQQVLDVGSGVGGPARRLASRFGADVCGIELSEVLHGTGEVLTQLVRLAGAVRHVHGSALSLPFDDATFDAVIMQHVAMQITEKDLLFAELARVVRPGGCLALHELFSGAGEIHYPLPWAIEPSMSALEPVEACADRLARLGFAVDPFGDKSGRDAASMPPTSPRMSVRWLPMRGRSASPSTPPRPGGRPRSRWNTISQVVRSGLACSSPRGLPDHRPVSGARRPIPPGESLQR